MAFNNIPYTDLNITNLDWLITQQGNAVEIAKKLVDGLYINGVYSYDSETVEIILEKDGAENG